MLCIAAYIQPWKIHYCKKALRILDRAENGQVEVLKSGAYIDPKVDDLSRPPKKIIIV